MPLHPVIQAALSSAAGLPAYDALPIAQARAQAKLGYPNRKEPVPVGEVRNLNIPGPGGALALRIFRPVAQGPNPMVVFFHGSGFVILDLDSHDDICRRLCAGASCVGVSVDYRLAPEHKFPAAPVTDYPTSTPNSYLAYGSGFGLKQAGIRWYWDQYLQDPSAANHPHASPLRAVSTEGLPSAYVLVAEFDVLRDEGEAFVRRLVEGGVETVTCRWAAMNHGFLKYTGVIEDADAAIANACAWLKRALQRSSSLIED